MASNRIIRYIDQSEGRMVLINEGSLLGLKSFLLPGDNVIHCGNPACRFCPEIAGLGYEPLSPAWQVAQQFITEDNPLPEIEDSVTRIRVVADPGGFGAWLFELGDNTVPVDVDEITTAIPLVPLPRSVYDLDGLRQRLPADYLDALTYAAQVAANLSSHEFHTRQEGIVAYARAALDNLPADNYYYCLVPPGYTWRPVHTL